MRARGALPTTSCRERRMDSDWRARTKRVRGGPPFLQEQFQKDNTLITASTSRLRLARACETGH